MIRNMNMTVVQGFGAFASESGEYDAHVND